MSTYETLEKQLFRHIHTEDICQCIIIYLCADSYIRVSLSHIILVLV